MNSTITGAHLPMLLWHPRKDDPDGGFRPERFAAPAAPGELAVHSKPLGGLWTSALTRHRGKHLSAFEMQAQRSGSGKGWGWVSPPWRVHAHDDARVLLVDSYADAELLYTRFGGPSPQPSLLPGDLAQMLGRHRRLDWERLAAVADAVVLTDRGLAQLNGGWTTFGMWDVPTVFWLNQAFWVQKPPPVQPRVGRSLSRGV